MNNIGKSGELVAANYLLAQKYEILEANYFNQKGYRIGEVDIIAESPNGEIVFVEVKSRKGKTENWIPGENISNQKIRRIIKTAHIYLKKRDSLEKSWRIDLIGVLFNTETRRASIHHIKSIHI